MSLNLAFCPFSIFRNPFQLCHFRGCSDGVTVIRVRYVLHQTRRERWKPTQYFCPKGRIDEAVDEKVDGGVHAHQEQRERRGEHDPQGQSVAGVVQVLSEGVHGEDFVRVEDDSRNVANEEQDHDGEEHQRLTPLFGGNLLLLLLLLMTLDDAGDVLLRTALLMIPHCLQIASSLLNGPGEKKHWWVQRRLRLYMRCETEKRNWHLTKQEASDEDRKLDVTNMCHAKGRKKMEGE